MTELAPFDSVSSIMEHIAHVFFKAAGYEVVDLQLTGFEFTYNHDDGSITIKTNEKAGISITLLPKVEE